MSFEGDSIGPERKRSTIRDVAALAGVSPSTVSHVINNSAGVSATTRARVDLAIRELGFEPNQSARSLKRPRVASIGLIVPDLRNPFFALVTEGVQEKALEEDVVVVLCATDARSEREDYYAGMLRSRRLDGVLYVSGTGISTRSLVELAAHGPIVLIDERLRGMEVPWVGAENRAGARRSAQHVLELGHRRLAFVSGPSALWSSEQRLAGYREAAAAAGLEPDSVAVVEGDYRQASGHAAAETLLAANAELRPTAILCANDLMAFGVLAYCRQAGISVPDELSVVGFDDVPAAELVCPSLTTVRQPAFEMGRAGTSVLLDRVAGRAITSDPPSLLPTELIERDSVGAPRP
ncbi:MAG: LacI family DNA-binding transcriptional regulator [Solirubrobacterales bacterium]